MQTNISSPPSGPLAELVKEICVSTGLPFGEVWIRPRRVVVPAVSRTATTSASAISHGLGAAPMGDRSYHGERALSKHHSRFAPNSRDFSWHGDRIKKTLRSLTGGMLAVPASQLPKTPAPTDFSPSVRDAQEPSLRGPALSAHGSLAPKIVHTTPEADVLHPSGRLASNGNSNGNSDVAASGVPEAVSPESNASSNAQGRPLPLEISPTVGVLGSAHSHKSKPEGAVRVDNDIECAEDSGGGGGFDGLHPKASPASPSSASGKRHGLLPRVGSLDKLKNFFGGDGSPAGNAYALDNASREHSQGMASDHRSNIPHPRGGSSNLGGVLGSPLGELMGNLGGGGAAGGARFEYEHFLRHSGVFYVSPSVLDDADTKNKVEGFLNLVDRTYIEGQGVEGLAWERGEADWRDLAEAKAGEDPELCSDPRCAAALDIFGGSLAIPIKIHEGRHHHEHVVAVVVLYSFSFDRLNNTPPGYVPTVGRDLARYVQDSMSLCVQLHYTESEWKTFKPGILVPQLDNHQAPHISSPVSSADFPEAPPPAPFLITFFKKMRGQKASPPKPNSAEFCLVTFIGCFLSLLALSATQEALRHHLFNDEEMVLLIGSFGALATLLFAAPVAPLAQPRVVIGGHLISASVGILADYLTNDDYLGILPQWVASALAPALAISLMAATGLTHPPAGACSLIYISGNDRIKSLGWLFVVSPVILGSLMMLGVALIVNNLSKHRKYPLFW